MEANQPSRGMSDDGRSFRDPQSSRWRAIAYVVAALIIGFLLGSCLSRPGPGPELVTKIERREISRIMLPFFPADVKNCSPNDFGQGASPLKESDATLDLALHGLQWCGIGKEVVIDVQGFSSQRPFDCGTPEASDHLNVEVAEARRQQVVAKIKAHLERHSAKYQNSVVRISPPDSAPRWAGASDQERLANMRHELAFYDHVVKADGKTPETFTRRVDIVVTKKGRCEPAGQSEQ